MKTKFLVAFAAAIVIGGISPAFATGVCTACKIKGLGSGPYFDQICGSAACVFILLDQVPVNRPACASNTGWHFALDVSTTAGKATYALLLSAYATGQTFNFAGNNSCALSPSGAVENFSYMMTAP